MKVIRIYEYPNCGTCKDALRFLSTNRFAVDRINIFEKAPTLDELRKMLAFQGGNIKQLFNTTGKVYQEMNLAERLPSLGVDEALKLLAANGKLIKRPFVLLEKTGLVGFKKDVWEKALELK